MTLVQEAAKKMESLPEECIRIIIALIDQMMPEKKVKSKTDAAKEKFLQTAGRIDIDEKAVSELRARSMI